MLRITVHEKPGSLRLVGPWVGVLEDCWQSAKARQRKPILRVDLTGITSIDAAGRSRLAAIHREGAEFVAADCLTKALVAEIASLGAGAGDKEG